MAEMKSDPKPLVFDEVFVISKITNHKLIGSNYLEWSTRFDFIEGALTKMITTDDPPTKKDDSRKMWLREDARLFLQIRTSIDNEVISLINHCELDYLSFYILEKTTFLVCMMFAKLFIVRRNKISLL